MKYGTIRDYIVNKKGCLTFFNFLLSWIKAVFNFESAYLIGFCKRMRWKTKKQLNIVGILF